MRFPVNWLKKHVKPFPENVDLLTDRLSMIGFMLDKPIEEVEGEKVIDLEFRRNRPDCEGVIGMAREIVAAFGGKLIMPRVKKLDGVDPIHGCEIKIKAEGLVKRFTALQIKVEPKITPEWIAKRLKAYGIEPSGNSVIDTTNYVMLEYGQPMHAFDLDKLRELEKKDRGTKPILLVRKAQKSEKILIIGNKNVALDENDLVIAGSKRPLAIAGVIGGEESSIDEETKEIILEAANYDRVSIRLTSRRLNLMTEAADRLQKDLDPNLTEEALKRALYILEQNSNAKLVGSFDYYPAPVKPITIDFNPGEVKRYGGVEIPEFEMVKILESLGMNVKKEREIGRLWKVEIPTYRTDLTLPVDLVEEILRIWGYEKIPSVSMETPIPTPIHFKEYEIEEECRDILTAMGLDELITIAATTIEKIKWAYKDKRNIDLNRIVALETPPTEYYTHLRTNMFATLLDIVKTKLDSSEERVAVFEIGRTYFTDESIKDDIPYREERRVASILTGNIDLLSWLNKPRNYSLFDAKGIATELLDKLEIRYELIPGSHPSFEDGTVLEVKSDSKTVGWIGEIARKVRERWGIDKPLYAFEFDTIMLSKTKKVHRSISKWSQYPKVTRDISLIVDNKIACERIVKEIKEAGGDILYSVSLIGLYSGEKLHRWKGKRNLVYRLTYWSKKKTLTNAEVEKIHHNIGMALIKRFKALIRGWEKKAFL